MTKVVRTTPIDRSKRTAVKGDIVSEVNIIAGKRKRRLSSNTFNEEYLVSTPKKKDKKKKKTQKQKKDLSESESEEESENEDVVEVIIPLSGSKNKYKIVDEDEDGEDEEEPEEELDTLFSQELKETERKIKKDSSSSTRESNESVLVCDDTEFEPITNLNPRRFFSDKIVKQVKRLGGQFPDTYNSANPIIYQSMKIFSPDSLRIFTRIDWGEKQCKYIGLFGYRFIQTY